MPVNQLIQEGIVAYNDKDILVAVSKFQKAVDMTSHIDFEHAEAVFNLGCVLQHDLKRTEEAKELYARFVTEDHPSQYATMVKKNFVCLLHADIASHYPHRTKEVLLADLAALSQCVNMVPDEASTYHNMGFLLDELVHRFRGNVEVSRVVSMYTKAFKLGYTDAIYNLGNYFRNQGDGKSALMYYTKAYEEKKKQVTRDETFAKTCNELVILLSKCGPYTPETFRLIETYINEAKTASLDLLPTTLTNEGFYHSHVHGDPKTAMDVYSRALQSLPKDTMLTSNLLLNYLYVNDSPTTLAYKHLHLCRRLPAMEDLPESNTFAPRSIGFLSGDFCRHAVSFFLDALLRHTHGWNVYCLSTTYINEEDMATLSKSLPNVTVVSLSQMDEREAILAIQTLHLSVLVDLAGHTSGTGVHWMRHRICPVQVTYLGYPSTTGIDTIDYRVSHRLCETPLSISSHTERVCLLDSRYFLSYTPPDQCVLPQNVVSLTDKRDPGIYRIALINKTSKWNHPSFLSFLEALLDELPPHVQLVIRTKSINRIKERFASYENCIVETIKPTFQEYLDAFNQYDLVLDTYPYNATTIACESLMMGCPIVTWKGPAHHTRVCQGLLKSVFGVQEAAPYIACNETDYIRCIKRLAFKKETIEERIQRRNTFLTAQDHTEFSKAFYYLMGCMENGIVVVEEQIRNEPRNDSVCVKSMFKKRIAESNHGRQP